MTQQSKQGQLPAGNPLASLLVIIVGAITIAVSVVVGFVAFVAVAGFVLILAIVIAIRTWWLRRQIQSGSRKQSAEKPSGSAANTVIEGEFKVVAKDEPAKPDS